MTSNRLTGTANWSFETGPTAFTITAPAVHAAAWQSYLADYLPEPTDLRLRGKPAAYRIDVAVGTDPLNNAVQRFRHAAEPRQIEIISGVVVTEASNGASRRCYTLDSDAVEGRPGAWAAGIDESRFPARIELFCRDADTAPRYLLRIIREILLRSCENAGGVVFHATGLDMEGAAVMICGARAAGKTTAVTALLRSTKASFLAGDRLIWHGGASSAGRLLPVPLPVAVGRGTIGAFEELRRAATPGWLSRPQTREWDKLPTEFASPVKTEFSAREYATAFGAHLSPGSRMSLVILPDLSDTHAPLGFHRLAAAERRSALEESCFTPHDEFWLRPWIVRRHASDAELTDHAKNVCSDLAARMQCVRVSFGVRNGIAELQEALARIVEEAI